MLSGSCLSFRKGWNNVLLMIKVRARGDTSSYLILSCKLISLGPDAGWEEVDDGWKVSVCIS